MDTGRVLMIGGAPGSGKSAVAPGLRTALPGVVVLDMDRFLEAGSRLAGVDLRRQAAADRWPAYNDLCLTFVSEVSAAGHDVLLLTPLTPDEVRRSTPAPRLGPARWAVLDCSDPTRRSRLRTRSSTAVDEDGAVADAAALRALGLSLLVNDGIGLDAAVDVVVRWARAQLAPRVSPRAGRGPSSSASTASGCP